MNSIHCLIFLWLNLSARQTSITGFSSNLEMFQVSVLCTTGLSSSFVIDSFIWKYFDTRIKTIHQDFRSNHWIIKQGWNEELEGQNQSVPIWDKEYPWNCLNGPTKQHKKFHYPLWRWSLHNLPESMRIPISYESMIISKWI